MIFRSWTHNTFRHLLSEEERKREEVEGEEVEEEKEEKVEEEERKGEEGKEEDKNMKGEIGEGGRAIWGKSGKCRKDLRQSKTGNLRS